MIETMGKKGKPSIHNAQEIKKDPSMHHNGRSALGIMETTEKKSKDVRRTEGSKVVDRENSLPASSVSAPCKSFEKKRKKMGRPVVVEDTGGEFPSVPLPLRYKVTVPPTVTCVSPASFNRCRINDSEEAAKRVRVTTAECIKPSSESRENGQTTKSSKHGPEAMDVERPQVFPSKDSSSDPATAKKRTATESAEARHASKSRVSENSSDLPSKGETNEKQSPRFYCFRKKVLAIMETDCKFSFHGKLKVRVLCGAARVYGYSMSAVNDKSFLPVYSPRAYSPIAIEVLDGEIADESLSKIWQILGEECDDGKLANRLRSDVSRMEEGWAVLLLENLDDRLTNFLAAHFSHNLFPRIDDPSNHSWRDPRRAEILLQANLRFDDTNQRTVIDSRGIDDVADAISYDWETKENSRTIVAGGKAVGKSTMARYLVNKLLGTCESVVFLDLDPGQAEFTPAGCVSLTIVEEPLLGPNFTHLQTPYHQLYLGSVDVTRCLTRYVNGVNKLVHRLNEDPRLSRRPVVVNTMGFCKGIGWDIMSYIIKTLSPTDVIQIMSKRSKNNFDDTLSRQVIDRPSLGWMSRREDTSMRDKPSRHRLHVIYSEAETGTGTAESWNFEAHQQRDLTIISYLSELAKTAEPSISQARGLSSTINAAPPYVIPFAAMSVSMDGAFVPQVLSAMNGNIVALCGVDAESTEKSDNDNREASSYPRVLVKPPLSTCYGFGILRGVDMEKKRMFLNTPLPPSHMKYVNCLVGSANVPHCLLQLDQQGAPYTGSEYDLPTSRGPRRGYVRTRCQVEA